MQNISSEKRYTNKIKLIDCVFAILGILLSGCASIREPSVQELIRQGRVEEAKDFFITKTDINAAEETGNTALHEAALKDDAELCTFLVFKGANVDVKNKKGDTPLHLAVKNKCINSASTLAGLGAGLFVKDATGKTALQIGLESDPAFYDVLITTKSGNVRDINGQSIVHYFVLTKDEKAISVCVAKKIPLSVKDDKGITPLELALSDSKDIRSVRIAAQLIEANADLVRGDYAYFEDAVKTRNPSMRFDLGQTPLHIACIQGQTGIVEYLIARGANLTLQDISGATSLHEATRHGNVDCANLLLQAGANVNAKDSLGKTPLLLIIEKEKALDMYNLLIANGADCQAKDMFGDNALHVATMNMVDTSILASLIEHGANVNERNKKGFTPLLVAVDLAIQEHISFYALHGADINAKDMTGKSPLLIALSMEDTLFLKSLLTIDNINTLDSSGNTALHTAILQGASFETIQFIISLGPDIDNRNKDGNSALYIAVEKENKEVIELLLENGADIFASNIENFSPLRLALTRGGEVQDWIITPLTIEATDGSGNTPLHKAAEWSLRGAVNALSSKGANVNARNANGETPLFYAAKGGDICIVEDLLDLGCDINAKDYRGNSSLHIAVQWDSYLVLNYLLKKGADADIQNFSGRSPLSDAVRSLKISSATVLIQNGANVNSCDISGRSILMDAVISGNIESVKFLLSNGANPTIQDMYGRTALHEAVEVGNIEMIYILRGAGCNPLSCDSYGKTPFSIAVTNPLTKGNKEVLEATLGNNKNIVDTQGNTPVHICILEDLGSNVLGYLVNKGYPLSTRNSSGKSPISLAIEKSKIGTINKVNGGKAEENADNLALVLLEAGADPFVTDNNDTSSVELAMQKRKDAILIKMVKMGMNRQDVQGNGFLHIAAKCATKEQIQTLFDLGLSKDAKNIAGETPYDVAIRWKRVQIAELLK